MSEPEESESSRNVLSSTACEPMLVFSHNSGLHVGNQRAFWKEVDMSICNGDFIREINIFVSRHDGDQRRVTKFCRNTHQAVNNAKSLQKLVDYRFSKRHMRQLIFWYVKDHRESVALRSLTFLISQSFCGTGS